MQLSSSTRRRMAGSTLATVALVAANPFTSSARPAGHAAVAPPAAMRAIAGTLVSPIPGTLRPGARVSRQALGKRVYVDTQHGFTLAAIGQAQYPAATVDGGRTWRTSGPALHVNAAQAPLAVTEVGALSRRVYFAGGDGEAVDATPDGGKHWYRALFNGGVIAVRGRGERILAVIASNEASKATNIWVYSSSDGGAHWHYEETI
jgi:hypothetical protein